MMKTKLFSKSAIGFGLLLLLAIILRFYQLHIPLLGEKEAAIALLAAKGLPNLADGVPGAYGFTAILRMVFFVLGQSEFSARLIPAIFGMIIILVPIFFRKTIGKETAIILSILLMLDPGQVAYSRQADGAIISVCSLLLTLGFLSHRKDIPAGIFAGLALLASPIIWPGLISLGLAFWLSSSKTEDQFSQVFKLEKSELITAVSALLFTLVIIGSAFFTQLSGIAAPILNLTTYIKGWFSTTEISPFLMLFSFLMYQPFILASGLFEGFRQIRSGDRINSFLMIWFFLSLILTVLYPSRGMDYLLFSYLPLLCLSARCILRIVQSFEKPDIPAYGQMALVVLLMLFSWLNIIVLKFPLEDQDNVLRAAAAGGALALLIIATLLIRMGWPPKQASTGVWMGLLVIIGLFTFSTAWRSAGLGIHPEAELWNYEGVTDELDLVKNTAGDLSEWNISSRTGINIVIQDYPSSALRWSLRDFTSVNEDKYLPSLSNPAIVITKSEQIPSLAEAYRGQDFALTRLTSWSLVMPDEWIKWYAFRQLPSETKQIILWARTDLFPGAAKTAPATINPIQ